MTTVLMTNLQDLIEQPITISSEKDENLNVFSRIKRTISDSLESRFLLWSRRSSLWGLTMGLACCALEMMAAGCGRFDGERFGVIWRPSPRHADFMVINGSITHKMAPRLRQLYDQMPYPKWLIAMGECAISGGPFFENYSIVKGGDKIIPVDVYVPGCPPRPEALLNGIAQLQLKIDKGKYWTSPEHVSNEINFDQVYG